MKANTNFARTLAAAGLVAIIGTMPAYAADVVIEEPPAPAVPLEVAPVASWAGPYVGLYGGYGFNGSTDDGVVDLDTDGFVGGIFGGFNAQNGAIVYGIEGDFGYNGMDGEDGTVSTERGLEGSLRARLGYAVTDRVLLYGTAGGAATQIDYVDTGVAAIDDDSVQLGWTAGAGVDAMLTDNVFGRLEYRYTDYGSEDFGGADVDSNDHRITFGVGMKF